MDDIRLYLNREEYHFCIEYSELSGHYEVLAEAKCFSLRVQQLLRPVFFSIPPICLQHVKPFEDDRVSDACLSQSIMYDFSDDKIGLSATSMHLPACMVLRWPASILSSELALQIPNDGFSHSSTRMAVDSS